MKPATVSLVIFLWIGTNLAAAGAIAGESAEEAKPTEVAKAAETKTEFKPPPGFATKKRGKLVLYCKRDTTIGTRFKTESCDDEDQMRDYMLALEENKRDIDRIRNTCSNPCACGMPDSC
jgi:hypothetical protein